MTAMTKDRVRKALNQTYDAIERPERRADHELDCKRPFIILDDCREDLQPEIR